jgi:SAM-dependent methyltransferase
MRRGGCEFATWAVAPVAIWHPWPRDTTSRELSIHPRPWPTRGDGWGRVDLPDESFDVVLLTDVLEHIENDADSAKRALQLLRPGGIIVATVPAYQWLYSPRDEEHHHFRRYSKERFQTLWALPNSEVAALSFYNSLLFPLAAAVRLASKFAPRRATLNDLTMPPRPLNTLLTRIMQSESHFIGRIPIHFGLSLIGVVRKR